MSFNPYALNYCNFLFAVYLDVHKGARLQAPVP